MLRLLDGVWKTAGDRPAPRALPAPGRCPHQGVARTRALPAPRALPWADLLQGVALGLDLVRLIPRTSHFSCDLRLSYREPAFLSGSPAG